MGGLKNGAFRLFRVGGITVYLHWTWFIIAFVEFKYRNNLFPDAPSYESPVWNLLEYLSLFGIVLLHEFGHALACRSVGGMARQIILWPLGGVAYVQPPPRPGAVLWSIAAGPLVNVLLVPVTIGLWALSNYLGWEASLPDLHIYLKSMLKINAGLLIFNLLPIYPLDGGQICQALLWFLIGRAQSLLVACILGMLGCAALGLLAIVVGFASGDPSSIIWLAIIIFFAFSRCLVGFRQAQFLLEMERAPRHEGLACPSCQQPPAMGDFWACDQCRTLFDPFEESGVCPECGADFKTITCPHCQRRHLLVEWFPQVETCKHEDVPT